MLPESRQLSPPSLCLVSGCREVAGVNRSDGRALDEIDGNGMTETLWKLVEEKAKNACLVGSPSAASRKDDRASQLAGCQDGIPPFF